MIEYIVIENGWSFIDEQKTGLPARMNPDLRKYLQAQRILCGLLSHELSPSTIVKPPGTLYAVLAKLGFKWYRTSKRWYISRTNRNKVEQMINDSCTR